VKTLALQFLPNSTALGACFALRNAITLVNIFVVYGRPCFSFSKRTVPLLSNSEIVWKDTHMKQNANGVYSQGWYSERRSGDAATWHG
jgi:hypothetical protein